MGAVLASLEPGDLVTYGEVADLAGYPRHSRAVGRVLARGGSDYCWWRVVDAAGRLVPHAEKEQTARLRAEGVRCRDGHVVGWRARAH